MKKVEKETNAVKTAEVKETKKTAKAPAKKTALKEEIVLQFAGKEITKDAVLKQVKEIWTKQMKNKVGDMKNVTLYLKPEESKAYYVINGDVTGSIDL